MRKFDSTGKYSRLGKPGTAMGSSPPVGKQWTRRATLRGEAGNPRIQKFDQPAYCAMGQPSTGEAQFGSIDDLAIDAQGTSTPRLHRR